MNRTSLILALLFTSILYNFRLLQRQSAVLGEKTDYIAQTRPTVLPTRAPPKTTPAGQVPCSRLSQFVNVYNSYCSDTPSVTPSPPVCKIDLQSISYLESCGTDSYRSINYLCSDGYKGSSGGPSSCKEKGTWYNYAVRFCANRCQTTPTPTVYRDTPPPTRAPSKTPYPSPQP